MIPELAARHSEAYLDEYFYDDFAESTSTELTSHTPNLSGAGWVRETGGAIGTCWPNESFAYPSGGAVTQFGHSYWQPRPAEYPLLVGNGLTTQLVAPLPSAFRVEIDPFVFPNSWGYNSAIQLGNTTNSNGLLIALGLHYDRLALMLDDAKVNQSNYATLQNGPAKFICEISFKADGMKWALKSGTNSTVSGYFNTTNRRIIGTTELKVFFSSFQVATLQNTRLYSLRVRGPKSFTLITP